MRHEFLEGCVRICQAANGLREAHQRGAQAKACVVGDVDEAEGSEPTHRLADLRADGLFSDPLVVLALSRVERANECLRTEKPGEPLQQHLPANDAAVLQGRRVEIEERQRLAHEHLARRKLTASQAIARRQ